MVDSYFGNGLDLYGIWNSNPISAWKDERFTPVTRCTPRCFTDKNQEHVQDWTKGGIEACREFRELLAEFIKSHERSNLSYYDQGYNTFLDCCKTLL